jgi:hypothetical protein
VAQFRIDKQEFVQPHNRTLFEVNMQADEYGHVMGGSQSGPTKYSSFGEPISVPIEPIIQLDALYGLDPREFETLSASTGSYESTGTLFKTHTGTGAFGYAVIRSNRILRYRPGQGAMLRFTAGFDNPQANVTLRAGFFTQEQSVMVGYDGTRFGVLRQSGGKAQIVKLTVSAGGTGNTTITLNGVSTNVAIASADTTVVAKTIANTSFAGWVVEQVDNTVSFLATSLGTKSGTYSLTGTGTGTFATIQAGAADVTNWTYQEDFNIDKLDGTGTSGVTIDPSKLNIYQINFRWLGAGEIRYAIENPLNGDMIFFHHEHYSNRNTDVHINNPSFRIGYVAANLTGNTITDAHTYGASMMAAVEGATKETAFPTGIISDAKTALGSGTYHSVISLKNSTVYQNRINLRAVILKKMSISVTSNAPTRYYLVLKGTKSTGYTWNKIANFSAVIQDISAGSFTFANEHPMAAFTLPSNGSAIMDLEDLKITIPPGMWIDLMVVGAQQINDVIASLTWIEI